MLKSLRQHGARPCVCSSRSVLIGVALLTAAALLGVANAPRRPPRQSLKLRRAYPPARRRRYERRRIPLRRLAEIGSARDLSARCHRHGTWRRSHPCADRRRIYLDHRRHSAGRVEHRSRQNSVCDGRWWGGCSRSRAKARISMSPWVPSSSPTSSKKRTSTTAAPSIRPRCWCIRRRRVSRNHPRSERPGARRHGHHRTAHAHPSMQVLAPTDRGPAPRRRRTAGTLRRDVDRVFRGAGTPARGQV